MRSSADLARALFEIAREIQDRCLFLANPEDRSLFEACISTLDVAASLDPAWDVPLIQKCVVIGLMRKRRPPEMAVAAEAAMRRRESYDAIYYLCRSWMENHPPAEAIARIQGVEATLENPDLQNLCNIFYAICNYQLGNVDSYSAFIRKFRENKRPEFAPYLALPVQTVRVLPVNAAPRTFKLFGRKPERLWEGRAEGAVNCLISASCDQRYLETYAEFFCESLARTQPDAVCHLSVSTDGAQAMAFLRGMPGWSAVKDKLIISAWNLDGSPNIGPISASLRMYHAEELMEEFAAPVAIVDFDTVFKAPLSDLLSRHEDADALFRLLSKVAPWEMITGGIVVLRPTQAGQAFASQAGKFLDETLTLDGNQWWVDQNALESAWRALGELEIPLRQHDVYRVRDQYLVQPTGKGETKIAVLRAALDQLRKLPERQASGAPLGTG